MTASTTRKKPAGDALETEATPRSMSMIGTPSSPSEAPSARVL